VDYRRFIKRVSTPVEVDLNAPTQPDRAPSRPPRRGVARLQRLRRGEPEPGSKPSSSRHSRRREGAVAQARPQPSGAALQVGSACAPPPHEPPTRVELNTAAGEPPAPRAARHVRHPDALAVVAEQVAAIIRSEGAITRAQLRDELCSSRRYAQALLEHVDAGRVTPRLPDDRRALRSRAAGAGPAQAPAAADPRETPAAR
jgi:selenocysteine-specific elongation factor